MAPLLWNANTHYHGLIRASLPADARCVLDVGCGDGLLSATLADAGVRQVIGLDSDAEVLDRARERHRGMGVGWVQGDVLDAPFAPESFDAVVSVAALHHMDAERALRRFAELVRPGGVICVVGLAAMDVFDFPLAGVAMVAKSFLRLAYGQWDHSARECWPPPLTYREMKAVSRRALPGVRYRRLLLDRYSLLWRST